MCLTQARMITLRAICAQMCLCCFSKTFTPTFSMLFAAHWTKALPRKDHQVGAVLEHLREGSKECVVVSKPLRGAKKMLLRFASALCLILLHAFTLPACCVALRTLHRCLLLTCSSALPHLFSSMLTCVLLYIYFLRRPRGCDARGGAQIHQGHQRPGACSLDLLI